VMTGCAQEIAAPSPSPVSAPGKFPCILFTLHFNYIATVHAFCLYCSSEL
jgi:hypothetical protein